MKGSTFEQRAYAFLIEAISDADTILPQIEINKLLAHLESSYRVGNGFNDTFSCTKGLSLITDFAKFFYSLPANIEKPESEHQNAVIQQVIGLVSKLKGIEYPTFETEFNCHLVCLLSIYLVLNV